MTFQKTIMYTLFDYALVNRHYHVEALDTYKLLITTLAIRCRDLTNHEHLTASVC